MWGMGDNGYGQLGAGTLRQTTQPLKIIVNTNYNQIFSQLLASGDVTLSFFGNAEANYVLDRSFSLVPANWIPQITNSANSFGGLTFTSTPTFFTNNFWRVRSVP
jgi:hypothetical protein